jgi:LmbE family N-acetylglucosaminyl deacetylase
MQEVAKILGADVRFLDYSDADVPAGDDLRESIVAVYRELKPDIVLTSSPLYGETTTEE